MDLTALLQQQNGIEQQNGIVHASYSELQLEELETIAGGGGYVPTSGWWCMTRFDWNDGELVERVECYYSPNFSYGEDGSVRG